MQWPGVANDDHLGHESAAQAVHPLFPSGHLAAHGARRRRSEVQATRAGGELFCTRNTTSLAVRMAAVRAAAPQLRVNVFDDGTFHWLTVLFSVFLRLQVRDWRATAVARERRSCEERKGHGVRCRRPQNRRGDNRSPQVVIGTSEICCCFLL